MIFLGWNSLLSYSTEAGFTVDVSYKPYSGGAAAGHVGYKL